MLYLETLGDLCLREGGAEGETLIRGSKTLIICAQLACNPDRSARRDYLTELLWPGVPARRARQSLRQALHYLRRRTGQRVVVGESSLVRLDETRIDVDLWRFESALANGRYAEAIALSGGRFLAGVERKGGTELEHWIESQDEQIRAGLELAHAELVARALAAGEADRAEEYARSYVDLNPLNERAQLALVRALKAKDDRLGALQAYRSYCSLLHNALDGEPSQELERAVASIREAAVEPDWEPEATVGHADSRRRWPLLLTGTVAGAVLAAGVALAAFTLYNTDRRSSPAAGVPEVALYVGVPSAGSETRLQLARIRRGRATLQPTWLGSLAVLPQALPSPDSVRVAFAVRDPEGWNLAVQQPGSPKPRVLTDAPDDETPRGWSPDGRYLLYRQGKPTRDGRGYTRVLMAYDLATGEKRVISELPALSGSGAAWSPDGTRIAFVADPDGSPDLFVTAADGTGTRRLFGSEGREASPSWSPDGRSIAFTSNRSGNSDIYAIEVDGSGLQRLTDTPRDEVTPVWLSSGWLAYVAKDGDHTGDLWAVNRYTREARRLSTGAHVRRLVPAGTIGREPSWLSEISIRPRSERVNPGQFIRLDARLRDIAGRSRASGHFPIRWRTADTTIAGFPSPSLLNVERPGRAAVVASAGGWIADTLHITSVPLVVRSLDPIFSEDWTLGLDPGRWIAFGEPRPYTRASGGPEGGGVFINNGDGHFHSGIVSRAAFSCARGLTLEVWGRIPFTNRLYQTFGFGLIAETDLPADRRSPPIPESPIGFEILGPTPDKPTQALLRTPSPGPPVYNVPAPDELDEWHLYALQLSPDGDLSLIIDGQLHWRSHSVAPVQNLGPLHVILGYRSESTEILHGPLRLLSKLKYTFADDTLREPTATTP